MLVYAGGDGCSHSELLLGLAVNDLREGIVSAWDSGPSQDFRGAVLNF
jgi:hypothetical protein